MVIINQVTDIDFQLLNNLFKKRGHGIQNPYFWNFIDTCLKENFGKILQCKCGEIIIMNNEELKQHSNKNLNSFVCKKCSKDDILLISYSFIEKINQLGREILSLTIDRNKPDFKNRFNEIKKKAKGLIATTSLDEMHYSYIKFRDFLEEIVPLHSESSKKIAKRSDWYIFTSNALQSIKGKFKNEEYQQLLWNFYKPESTLNKMKEFEFQSRQFNYFKENILKSKYLPNDDLLIAPTLEKDYEETHIRKIITLFRIQVENQFILYIIQNVINMQNGIPFSVDPFKKYLAFNPGLQKKFLRSYKNSIWAKIEIISSNNSLPSALRNELTKIYDTHLRNDDAHVQFIIDTQSKTVESLKYNEKRSFDEIKEIFSQMTLFIGAINYALEEEQENSRKDDLRKQGIEFVIMGHGEFAVINNRILPKNNSIPWLLIHQFIHFNPKNDRIIPIPKFRFIKNKNIIEIEFNLSVSFRFSIESKDVQIWISEIIRTKVYEIHLLTIAPYFSPIIVKYGLLTPIIHKEGFKLLVIGNKILELKLSEKGLSFFQTIHRIIS